MNHPRSTPRHEPGTPLPSTASGPVRRRFPWRTTLGVVGLAGLVMVSLGVYWSIHPTPLDGAAVAAAELGERAGDGTPGTRSVEVAVGIGESLLRKPGGFLYNDRLPPGVFLDNTQSWECGNLMALRDFVRALRNDFSRSQSQSFENADVKEADLRFAIDPKSWMLPSAETEYELGIEALERFLADLSGGDQPRAQFFARADNLAAYLAVVEKRLGHFGVRLSSSVPDSDLAAAIGIPRAGDEGALLDEEPVPIQTPWHQVDNVYYCARGYSWALYHLMQAIASDFEGVLAAKRAEVSLQQIIRDLKGATKPMGSPIVLNGDGYGILANHSLVLASYIAKANAALMDLRTLMQQG
ncbi:DUF2333 family protein [Thiocapsa marina]|uniref:Uncharacterized conserved protein UCP029693 n=1 Tax=Thiocapsa marina 5811 TaxID=768671 RepID=F9U811_9GAMM|nr:DUF2333 family protein [Thiocapsa marina]EGV19791.1 Uncharacterized conserved protein UCP029693 [Thiocapsa marina 5811]